MPLNYSLYLALSTMINQLWREEREKKEGFEMNRAKKKS